MFNQFTIKITVFLLFFWLFSGFSLPAQSKDVLMTNSQKMDTERYAGIKGSPYFFKEWQTGTIITEDGKNIEQVTLNYNGESQNMEIKKGDQFIELAPTGYQKIAIQATQETTITFILGENAPLKNKFIKLVYQGKDFKVVSDFTAKIETKVFNNVGKKEEFKSFYTKTQYYLITDKITTFRLKSKEVLPLFDHQKELEQFVKKEKMKLNSEEQLLKLLKYCESL